MKTLFDNEKPKDTAIVYFDGACQPNPGRGAWKYLIIFQDLGYSLPAKGVLAGKSTNQIAEYTGLIASLNRCIGLGVKNISIFGDSKLVVQQVNGLWMVKAEHLKTLWEICINLAKNFDYFSLTWIPREDNIDAEDVIRTISRSNLGE